MRINRATLNDVVAGVAIAIIFGLTTYFTFFKH